MRNPFYSKAVETDHNPMSFPFQLSLFVHGYNGQIVYGRLCNNPHSMSVTLVILAKASNVREVQEVGGRLPAVMCHEKLIKHLINE